MYRPDTITTILITILAVCSPLIVDGLRRTSLRELFIRIYNPPTPLNLSLGAIIIAACLPGWIRRYREWRLGQRAVRFDWPVPKAADPTWTSRVIESPTLFSHLEDDSLLHPGAGLYRTKEQYLTCYDPSTAYYLGTMPLLSSAEISEQVIKADQAQPAWAKTSFAQRKMVLQSLKAWCLRDMEGIVRVACRDTGKTEVDAVFGEILTTLSKINWLLDYGEATLSPSQRPTPLLLAHKIAKVHYAPLGVTLACVSWNYSFHNLISPILASLFAGNAVVVKCSEQVAWSSRWYVGGIRNCLEACGFDPEVVQLVVCLPEIAGEITRNPLIRHITFIGSEPVGRKVAAAAAEIMVPTCIELGGKDPAFILPGCKLEPFASTWMRGAFQSSGQNCIGIELFLLPRTLYPQFLQLMEPCVKSSRPGKDVGSLISHTPIPRLESILSEAVSAGAKILVGGKQYHHPDHPHGAYFQPTLIVDVTMDMDVAKEELFAPVMTVVVYDDVEEAIGWLNKSRFGLGAGVYGEDKGQCERVAGRLECGMVSINDYGVFYLNQAMPFGGVKASGHGRFGGEEGLRSLTSIKTVVGDRFFSWVRTPIPKPVDFPLPARETSWKFLHGLIMMVYGANVARGKGVVELVRASLGF